MYASLTNLDAGTCSELVFSACEMYMSDSVQEQWIEQAQHPFAFIYSFPRQHCLLIALKCDSAPYWAISGIDFGHDSLEPRCVENRVFDVVKTFFYAIPMRFSGHSLLKCYQSATDSKGEDKQNCFVTFGEEHRYMSTVCT